MPINNLTRNEEPAGRPVEDVLLTQLGLRSDRLVHLGAPHHPVVPEDNLTVLEWLRVRLNRHLCFFRSKSRLLSMWLAPRINLRNDSTRLTCGPKTSATSVQPKKEQRRENMKTNYGMETDPPPQVWSTIGRRILWPSRVLNIKDWFKVWAFIQRLGCPHPRKTNILVSDQMAIPPPPKKVVMWICLTLAPPNTLG